MLALMRRHPSWPGPGSDTRAAAAADRAGSPAAFATAPLEPASPSSPQLSPAQGGSRDQQTGTPAVDSIAAADTEDGDSDSDGDVAVSQDGQVTLQDEVVSPAAAAAAAPAAAAAATPHMRRSGSRKSGSRSYTEEEQAVMRELHVSELTNILRVEPSAGTIRWRVSLSAEGLNKLRNLFGESLTSLGVHVYVCQQQGGGVLITKGDDLVTGWRLDEHSSRLGGLSLSWHQLVAHNVNGSGWLILLAHPSFAPFTFCNKFHRSTLHPYCTLAHGQSSRFAAAHLHALVAVQLASTKIWLRLLGSGTWPCWPCMAGRNAIPLPQPRCCRPAATARRK